MEKETTKKEILGAVERISKRIEESIERLDKKTEGSIEKLSKKTEESISELHEAVGEFSNRVDARFEKIESQMVTKDYLEDRLSAFETKMVTKDYLDEKLSDLKTDLTEVIRKEDKKVVSLAEVLHKNKALSKEDKKHILQMEPFPKSA